MVINSIPRNSAEVVSFPRLKLADDPQQRVSDRTIEALKSLLKAAQEGSVVGLCYGVLFAGGGCAVNVIGGCSDRLIYARGMVASLDDELSRLIEEQAMAAPEVSL